MLHITYKVTCDCCGEVVLEEVYNLPANTPVPQPQHKYMTVANQYNFCEVCWARSLKILRIPPADYHNAKCQETTA